MGLRRKNMEMSICRRPVSIQEAYTKVLNSQILARSKIKAKTIITVDGSAMDG